MKIFKAFIQLCMAGFIGTLVSSLLITGSDNWKIALSGMAVCILIRTLNNKN